MWIREETRGEKTEKGREHRRDGDIRISSILHTQPKCTVKIMNVSLCK